MGKKSNPQKVFQIIHFEDKGQDFLCWHLDADGVVLLSEPFQTPVWKGGQVMCAHGLRVGSKVHYVPRKWPPTILKLKYKVIRVERIPDCTPPRERS